MSDPLQVLLQGPAKPSLFPPDSRYAGIDTGKLTTVDGKTIVYLRRRFVPPPERFWQICDANAAMRPEELTEIVGRTLRITLPEGIPGQPNA